jgi:hypothetical protein
VNSVLTLGTNSCLILLTSRWMLFKLRTRHDRLGSRNARKVAK